MWSPALMLAHHVRNYSGDVRAKACSLRLPPARAKFEKLQQRLFVRMRCGVGWTKVRGRGGDFFPQIPARAAGQQRRGSRGAAAAAGFGWISPPRKLPLLSIRIGILFSVSLRLASRTSKAAKT
ncbi:hypothetical protein L1887_61956 [Cichorium endivia]|nr:hypothetical protein L1887_61956 [Cichorium endivia]